MGVALRRTATAAPRDDGPAGHPTHPRQAASAVLSRPDDRFRASGPSSGAAGAERPDSFVRNDRGRPARDDAVSGLHTPSSGPQDGRASQCLLTNDSGPSRRPARARAPRGAIRSPGRVLLPGRPPPSPAEREHGAPRGRRRRRTPVGSAHARSRGRSHHGPVRTPPDERFRPVTQEDAPRPPRRRRRGPHGGPIRSPRALLLEPGSRRPACSGNPASSRPSRATRPPTVLMALLSPSEPRSLTIVEKSVDARG